MNWDAISFDWNHVRALLATAEEGSYSGAARVLKTTQPTIGRQISALEASLGVTLVERNVKGQSLTQAGSDLLDHVRRMGDAATLISMIAERQAQEVTGEVVITATDLLSAAILPRILLPLRETAPGIKVRLNASNDIQNLMQREADIAIRHSRPSQPDLVACHVGNFSANLYAARSYLDRKGRPQTLRDVADHDFVGNADQEHLLAPLNSIGIPICSENFVVTSDSGVVPWELAKSGYGVSMQPEVLGDAEPSVEKVFEEFPSLEFPIWLVTHREVQTTPRIRVVFDLLTRGLGETTQPAVSSRPMRRE